MKSVFCLLLFLSLLCAETALADTQVTTSGGAGKTTVTYNVPETPSEFTVIIPADVSIPRGEMSTSMQISIANDSTLEVDKILSVTLESSANDFKLQQTDGGDSIVYMVSKDDQTISAGDTVLSWTSGNGIPGAVTLTMVLMEDIAEKPAGDYSDTLTFKVNVVT